MIKISSVEYIKYYRFDFVYINGFIFLIFIFYYRIEGKQIIDLSLQFCIQIVFGCICSKYEFRNNDIFIINRENLEVM